jgi:hypothetical protein
MTGLRWFKAGIAVAAGRAGFAKVIQQAHPATAGGFAQTEQGVELGKRYAAIFFAALGLIYHAALLHHVTQAVGHPGVGGCAVAACATGFLIVAFHAFGQVEMSDEAHIGLVYAHAESDGGDHHDALVALEACLVIGARSGIHAGVIGQRIHALRRQPRRGFVHLPARQAVDDAGCARVFATDEAQQLVARVVLVDDGVADVGTIEARNKHPRALEREPVHDLGARLRVCSGGERDARHLRETLVQYRQLQIFRAEIMPPLRNAVRLVNGEQCQS